MKYNPYYIHTKISLCTTLNTWYFYTSLSILFYSLLTSAATHQITILHIGITIFRLIRHIEAWWRHMASQNWVNFGSSNDLLPDGITRNNAGLPLIMYIFQRHFFVQGNEFWNVVYKMTSIMSRPHLTMRNGDYAKFSGQWKLSSSLLIHIQSIVCSYLSRP